MIELVSRDGDRVSFRVRRDVDPALHAFLMKATNPPVSAT